MQEQMARLYRAVYHDTRARRDFRRRLRCCQYVPPILQGVVQGALVSGGVEAIQHGGQAASFAAGVGFLAAAAASRGY